MFNSKRLVLAHFWLVFIAFGVALLLGAWQMLVRSPLHSWLQNPEFYYRSVTAHGTVMGYAFPTLIAMGFGYAVRELALKRSLVDLRWRGSAGGSSPSARCARKRPSRWASPPCSTRFTRR